MNLLGKLALTSTLGLASCISGPFVEESRSPGHAQFKGGKILTYTKILDVYAGNDLTHIPGKGFDVDGQKDVFVEGEPIKVGFYLSGNIDRGLENGSVGITKLFRNGEVDVSRTRRINSGSYMIIDYGAQLDMGNYTVSHQGGEAFMGSIDFQVVSPPNKVADNKR